MLVKQCLVPFVTVIVIVIAVSGVEFAIRPVSISSGVASLGWTRRGNFRTEGPEKIENFEIFSGNAYDFSEPQTRPGRGRRQEEGDSSP